MSDNCAETREKKITLCLSGGGFRAVFFHAGLVRQMIELDVFQKVGGINSVSGGSLLSGLIVREITERGCFADVADYDRRVLIPLMDFTQLSPPKRHIYKVLPWMSDTSGFIRLLDGVLFHNMSFADLSSDLSWNCYATNLQTGRSWKFSNNWVGGPLYGYAAPDKHDYLSVGVAASACFPPVFSPVKYTLGQDMWKRLRYRHADQKRKELNLKRKCDLVDGGVFDNIAAESLVSGERGLPFLVSDASSSIVEYEGYGRHRANPISAVKCLKRCVDIATWQNAANRRRIIYEQFVHGTQGAMVELCKPLATYSTIAAGELESPTALEEMPEYQQLPSGLENVAGKIRTDFDAFHDSEILLLLWSGMSRIDAVLKRWMPGMVDRGKWHRIPRIDALWLKDMEDVLAISSNRKVYGKLHGSLHGERNLKDNLDKAIRY